MPNLNGFKERWQQGYDAYRRHHDEGEPFNALDGLISHVRAVADAGAYATFVALSRDGLPPEQSADQALPEASRSADADNAE